MRMMGLRELPYWGSYLIVDGGFQGICLSFALTVLSAATDLFWKLGEGGKGRGDGSFGDLFILLFFSSFAFTTMAFAIAACFDNAQIASMVAFLLLLGSVNALLHLYHNSVHLLAHAFSHLSLANPLAPT